MGHDLYNHVRVGSVDNDLFAPFGRIDQTDEIRLSFSD